MAHYININSPFGNKIEYNQGISEVSNLGEWLERFISKNVSPSDPVDLETMNTSFLEKSSVSGSEENKAFKEYISPILAQPNNRIGNKKRATDPKKILDLINEFKDSDKIPEEEANTFLFGPGTSDKKSKLNISGDNSEKFEKASKVSDKSFNDVYSENNISNLTYEEIFALRMDTSHHISDNKAKEIIDAVLQDMLGGYNSMDAADILLRRDNRDYSIDDSIRDTFGGPGKENDLTQDDIDIIKKELYDEYQYLFDFFNDVYDSNRRYSKTSKGTTKYKKQVPIKIGLKNSYINTEGKSTKDKYLYTYLDNIPKRQDSSAEMNTFVDTFVMDPSYWPRLSDSKAQLRSLISLGSAIGSDFKTEVLDLEKYPELGDETPVSETKKEVVNMNKKGYKSSDGDILKDSYFFQMKDENSSMDSIASYFEEIESGYDDREKTVDDDRDVFRTTTTYKAVLKSFRMLLDAYYSEDSEKMKVIGTEYQKQYLGSYREEIERKQAYLKINLDKLSVDQKESFIKEITDLMKEYNNILKDFNSLLEKKDYKGIVKYIYDILKEGLSEEDLKAQVVKSKKEKADKRKSITTKPNVARYLEYSPDQGHAIKIPQVEQNKALKNGLRYEHVIPHNVMKQMVSDLYVLMSDSEGNIIEGNDFMKAAADLIDKIYTVAWVDRRYDFNIDESDLTASMPKEFNKFRKELIQKAKDGNLDSIPDSQFFNEISSRYAEASGLTPNESGVKGGTGLLKRVSDIPGGGDVNSTIKLGIPNKDIAPIDFSQDSRSTKKARPIKLNNTVANREASFPLEELSPKNKVEISSTYDPNKGNFDFQQALKNSIVGIEKIDRKTGERILDKKKLAEPRKILDTTFKEVLKNKLNDPNMENVYVGPRFYEALETTNSNRNETDFALRESKQPKLTSLIFGYYG